MRKPTPVSVSVHSTRVQILKQINLNIASNWFCVTAIAMKYSTLKRETATRQQRKFFAVRRNNCHFYVKCSEETHPASRLATCSWFRRVFLARLVFTHIFLSHRSDSRSFYESETQQSDTIKEFVPRFQSLDLYFLIAQLRNAVTFNRNTFITY